MDAKILSDALISGRNLDNSLDIGANNNETNKAGEPILKSVKGPQSKIALPENLNQGVTPLSKRKVKGIQIDIGKISQAWDVAQKFYQKKFPAFDQIEIFHDGKKVSFSGLPRDKQIALLKEGARGGDKDSVDKLEKDKSNLPEEDFKQAVVDLLDVTPGEKSKYHGADHAVRAALLVEAIASLYGEIFEDFPKLTSEDLENAIIAAMFHDSGRQSDGIDVYDELSANNAEEAFKDIFDETRREKIKNIILNKDAPLSKGDASGASLPKKDLATILLHEADCIEFVRLEDFNARYLDALHQTSSRKDPSFFNFKLNPKISLEEAETKLIALICKTKELQGEISDFVLEDTEKFSSSIEIISPVNKKSYECKNSYELCRAIAEDHTFLFDTEYTYYKCQHAPCNDLLCAEKMSEVTSETIAAFLEKNKPSEIFRHENVFEISGVILKCLKDPDSRLNRREDIEELKSVASLCQKLREFGASGKFAQITAFYRLQMIEEGVFQELRSTSPEDVTTRQGISTNYHNSKLTRVEFRRDISNRYMNPIGQYINTHGGSWALVELIMSHQIASGLSLLPILVKTWMHQQIGGNMISKFPFFPDNRQPDSETTIADVRKGKSSLLATYKSGRDYGGKDGRKSLLTDASNLPDSFWQNEITKLLAVKFHISNKKFKEQIMLEKIIKLVEDAQNATSNEDLSKFKECEQELNEYSLELDKYIQETKQMEEKYLDENKEREEEVERNEEYDSDEENDFSQKVIESLSYIRDVIKGISAKKQELLLIPNSFKELSQNLKRHQTILDKFSQQEVARDARFYTADSFDSRIRKAAKVSQTVGVPSMFDKTLYMMYAANQEILHYLDQKKALSQENEPGSVKLYRRFDDKNKASIGKEGTMMDSSVYDSFSLKELPSSYGFGPYKYSAMVPFCRIWTSYFFKSLMNGALNNDSDCETEFTVMANGLKLTYQGKDESLHIR